MEKTYSVDETAKLLGYSRNSIYSFLKEGNLKGARVGKGKIRVPQSEIDRFVKGGDRESEIINSKEKQQSKKIVEGMVREAKDETHPDSEVPLVLNAPRPGKSLEDLSGERPISVLKLWFEERVGIPRLFDWLIGLSSIILGVSMFLHTKQVDSLIVGRFADWFTPIRIALILSGFGLIVADMIQEEFVLYRNLSNYFRVVLFIAFLGLSWILFLGNDIDGFMIYGLFGLAILLEAILAVRSSTAYMLYIQGLFIGTGLLFLFYPTDPSISPIAGGLFYVLDGFKWVWVLVVISFVLLTLFGYFWEKKVLKNISAVMGVILLFLALFYANNNYWDRAFFVLLTGMVGLILPFWEAFKKKFVIDRPLVFRMFGTILMFFSLVVVLIAIIQSVLMEDANRRLADKAEFGRITTENTINAGLSALEGIAGNPLFMKAFMTGNAAEIESFSKAIFKNNNDLGVVVAVSATGSAVSSYPFSSEIAGRDYGGEIFFRNILADNNYVSKTAETFVGVSRTAIIIGTPILSEGKVVGGMVATVSLSSLGDRLEELAESTVDQEVTLLDSDGRWLVSPGTGVIGEKVIESDTTSLMWSTSAPAEIGYDSLGKYRLFRSSRSKEFGWTVVMTEPVFSILNVSRSGLMIVLFLLSVAVITVSSSYLFARKKE